MTRADWLMFGLICTAAYLLRFMYLLEIKGNPFFVPRSLDPLFYHSWAIRISHGAWIGDTVFEGMPLYAYFLGIIYKLAGVDVFVARAVQMVFAAVTCGLIYIIGGKSLFRVVGLLAGVCAVLYKPFIFYDGMIIGASLAVFLYAAALIAALYFVDSFSWKNAVIFGGLSGIAALCRPGILLFPVVLTIMYAIRFTGERRWFILKRFGVVLASMFMMVAAATIHNYLASDSFVLITAHGGLNYYIGNNPEATGKFHAPPGIGRQSDKMFENAKHVAEDELGRTLTASQVSQYWKYKANQFIRKNPLQFVSLMFKKLFLFCQGGEISDFRNIEFFKRFSPIMQFPLPGFLWIVPWAILGMMLAIGRNRYITVMHCLFWSYLGGLLLYFVNSRYRLPMVPMLMVFASYGLMTTISFLRTNRRRAVALLLAAGCLYVLTGVYREQPKLADDYNELASWYMTDQHNFMKAIALYKEALKLDPDNQYVYYNMGRAYFTLNRLDDALDAFKHAIELNRNDYESINFYGILLSKKGMHEKAINYFKKAISVKPDYYLALNNMGAVYAIMDEKELARQAYEKSLQINPNQPDVRAKLK